jgi:hypothetical protein
MRPTPEGRAIAESQPLTEIGPGAPTRWGPDAARLARVARYRSLLLTRWADWVYGSASRTVAGSPGEELAFAQTPLR